MNKTIVFLTMSVLAFSALAAEPLSKSVPKGWGEDFSAARAQAAKENKQILMAFSGSDWCPWCVKMEKDVFSKPEFVNAATNDFVLVLIDCPSDETILSKLARKQNRELATRYAVRGFPCTVVVDAKGKELRRISGYRPTPQAALNEFKGK